MDITYQIVIFLILIIGLLILGYCKYQGFMIWFNKQKILWRLYGELKEINNAIEIVKHTLRNNGSVVIYHGSGSIRNRAVLRLLSQQQIIIENCIHYQNTVPVWFVFAFFLYTLRSCIDCIAKWKKKKDNLPVFREPEYGARDDNYDPIGFVKGRPVIKKKKQPVIKKKKRYRRPTYNFKGTGKSRRKSRRKLSLQRDTKREVKYEITHHYNIETTNFSTDTYEELEREWDVYNDALQKQTECKRCKKGNCTKQHAFVRKPKRKLSK